MGGRREEGGNKGRKEERKEGGTRQPTDSRQTTPITLQTQKQSRNDNRTSNRDWILTSRLIANMLVFTKFQVNDTEHAHAHM